MSKKVFTGQIGRTVAETEYGYEKKGTTPKNAPNVVCIVLDDVGFASLGCYGSDIHTPNINRLAGEGLRYNNFHTTAVCSATRASLLTGANHHIVGVASLVEWDTGCTNSNGHIDSAYGTTAEILKEYGYATYASGKWHLSQEKCSSGPYNNWPLAKGFDRYYGFIAAETDHYHPQLVRDNSYINQPKSAKDGYHLTEDITDHSIDFIFNHVNAFPDKPFFLYTAYGAAHAPQQVSHEYADRYKGKFDDGWDKIRQRWFENQKRIGIIPADAELTDRAPFVEAWDDLDDDRKKLYSRYMEVFAGVMEYTDEQIGRLLDYLKSIGELDNTVIVLISDNGASPEGGTEGRINRYTEANLFGSKEEMDFALAHLDEIGGEYSFNQYPSGWANACNTPFQWYKYLNHEGGVKDPMIIRYPGLIKDGGTVRQQYTHVSDITPTILDIIGVKKPECIKGVYQKPFTGTSFKYTFSDAQAKDRKLVQYYEILGNRAIYKDGWKAVVNHVFSKTYAEDVWELYHVAKDYSEKHNVAAEYPEKLHELQEEFLIEAGRNNVFPLMMNSHLGNNDTFGLPEIPENKLIFKNIFKPYRIARPHSIDNMDHDIEVVIHREYGDEGVLFSSGDRFGGFTFYIKDNRLKYVLNANRFVYFKAESDGELPTGEITVKYIYEFKGSDGAVITLYVNGLETGSVHAKKLYFMKGCYAESTIRANFYTEVSPEYEVPFEFSGDILKLTLHSYGTSGNPEKDMKRVLHAE